MLLKITSAQKVRIERTFLTFSKNTKKVRFYRTYDESEEKIFTFTHYVVLKDIINFLKILILDSICIQKVRW